VTNSDDDSLRLQRVMSALADIAEEASDAELLNEAGVAGVDVSAEANRVRTLLLGGLLAGKKERLHKAQRDHGESVASLGSRTSKVPADPAARRAMLFGVLQRRPEMRPAMVTLQHREFESFSDADVESVLHQLDLLGALDDEGHEPGS